MANIMEMGKNPNYLGSYDLYDLNTSEIIVTIKAFKEEEVVNNGSKEVCAVMYFEEKYKPMIINPTNKKTLAKLFHTVMSEKIIGNKICIKIEKVKAFGKFHDALRIKDTLPKVEPPEFCELCKKAIAPAGGMSSSQVAAYTKSKYGKKLCGECAAAENQKMKGNDSNESNENQDK